MTFAAVTFHSANLFGAGQALDVDGDFFAILTEQEGTGFPKIQFIEAHQVEIGEALATEKLQIQPPTMV